MREYTVNAVPVPQGRPRAFRRGKFIGFYDPKKSRDWKDLVSGEIKRQHPTYVEGAISLSLFFKLPAPKSNKPGRPHISRPDLDNLAKAVKDALKGICWKDDSQINTLYARKVYANTPSDCGVIIRVSHDETAE